MAFVMDLSVFQIALLFLVFIFNYLKYFTVGLKFLFIKKRLEVEDLIKTRYLLTDILFLYYLFRGQYE